MDIFEFYADLSKRDELASILTLGAQQHPSGLADSFLEKDIWVTEILHLLFDEGLVGKHAVAFKGGTALSKCWGVIERFSEDIDLSIHWSDLAGEDDEEEAWVQSTSNASQNKKFRKLQENKLEEWSTELVKCLNNRFADYGIKDLRAELEPRTKGEKINVIFPRVTSNSNAYHLDHILLEFGGRNRGRPTVTHKTSCYIAGVEALSAVTFPTASVQALEPAYILWEKLTALHTFSTQEKDPDTHRLARHWYDVDCLLQSQFADPLSTLTAMRDVIKMKKNRWPQKGVDFEDVSQGNLNLVPSIDRLKEIAQDHQAAINGGMFFSEPDSFDSIVARILTVQKAFNLAMVESAES